MVMVIISLMYVLECDSLEYDFKTAVGQMIVDKSGSGLNSILGGSILIESVDPILTDRGAYFNGSTYISMPPNTLYPNSHLSITSDYLFTLCLKPLIAGCVLSIVDGATTKLKLC